MVQIYQSTDTDAPILSGTAGALLSVFRACLVDGYGDKPSLGWEIESSANGLLAVFSPTDIAASGIALLVDDSASGGGGGRFALARGLNDGGWLGFDGDTPLFNDALSYPSVAASSFGASWAKSSLANNAARDWILVGDGRTFYFFSDWAGRGLGASPNDVAFHIFGAMAAVDTANAGMALHSANTVDDSSTNVFNTGTRWRGGALSPSPSSPTEAGYTSGNHTYLIPNSRFDSNSRTGLGSSFANSLVAYPITQDGGILIEEVPVMTSDSPWQYLGAYRGAYGLAHHLPLPHGHIIDGAASPIPGRRLMVIACATAQRTGSVVIDLDGPW